MECQKIVFIFYTVAILVCCLLCLQMTSAEIGLEEDIEQQLYKEQFSNPSQNSYNSLKRKRRYLEFPEGSSFQLVYDLIIGVVDYTNYLILGVTVALAWELPSKPPSEILSDISERLKDGTLGTSRNDTVEKVKYIDHDKAAISKTYQYKLQPMFKPPMHYHYYTPRMPDSFYRYPNNKQSLQGFNVYKPKQYNSWSTNHKKFYSPIQRHPFGKWSETKKLPTFSAKGSKYPWWHLPERLNNSFNTQSSVRRFDKNINYSRAYASNKKSYSSFGGTGRSEHRVYPVFGKRSILAEQATNENLTSTQTRYRRRSGINTATLSKLDRIHIDQHRRTRHDLYERIETYLNGRGSHGHHCVLRALCETGRKSNEQEPGSFVGELMRAIFTMPEPLDGHPQIGYKELRYDTASSLKEDCASRYTRCKDSLWSSQFVL